MQTDFDGRHYQALVRVMKRYEDYQPFLKYPRDYGERAFRGWLVFDLFHKELDWPIENILFGEIFDVLLLDDELNPRINIETKKPGDGLVNHSEFIGRLPDYQTLYYGILTDGYDWLTHNCNNNREIKFNINQGPFEFNKFIKTFLSKKYIIGDVDE